MDAVPIANVFINLSQNVLDASCTHFSLVISGATGRKLTKFLHDVGESSLLLARQSALRYFNPLQGASGTNDGRYANFANLSSKNRLPRERPLSDCKTNIALINRSHISGDLDNLMKTGSVLSEVCTLYKVSH